MNIFKRGKTPSNFTGRSCARTVLWLSAMFALAVGFVAQSPGQTRDVSTLFPEPNQVKADFPDDAERYAAFLALSTSLNATAPRPL
jgi:hypothetical protein